MAEAFGGKLPQTENASPQPGGNPVANARVEERRSGQGIAGRVRPRTGHIRIQDARPQTPACGLTDPPAGLAARIAKTFHVRTDRDDDFETMTDRDRQLANTRAASWPASRARRQRTCPADGSGATHAVISKNMHSDLADDQMKAATLGLFEILTQVRSAADTAPIRIHRGEVLISQGSPSTEIYLVLAGRFRIERDGHFLGYADAGSVLGEIAFFTGARRSATVLAFRDSLVLRFTRSSYEALCGQEPRVVNAVSAILAERVAERHERRFGSQEEADLPRTVAVLPVGTFAVPEDLPARLTQAVNRYKSAKLITRSDFHKRAEGVALDSARALDRFAAIERNAELTIYVADPSAQGWTKAVLRQSDQLLLVAPAGAPPPLSETERDALALIPAEQRRLVLLHPARRHAVAGTRKWFDLRPAGFHHHLALSDDVDIARLARFLAGEAVGLVCSGGGALGLAHAAVYQALVDAGAGFDVLGGTSVGSAMTAAFAQGHGREAVAQWVQDAFVRRGVLRRLTLPKYALLDHRLFDDMLRDSYRDIVIEDLWLPYFAVAANLDSDRLEVIRQGPLWQAVRASCALPGILPPFIRSDGTVLVDGGILDNMPHRTMRSLKAGPNVLVSLDRDRGGARGYRYADIPGPLRLLGEMVWPFRRRTQPAPPISETIIRSMGAGRSGRGRMLGPRDILFRPPLPEEMGFMSWSDAQSTLQPARDHARSRIRDLRNDDPALWAILRSAGAAGPV